MNRLLCHFGSGIVSANMERVGMEVETQFFGDVGNPISTEVSQGMFVSLVRSGWQVRTSKNGLLTSIVDSLGNTFSYELGRHNIELSGIALEVDRVLENTHKCLNQLYKAGRENGAFPMFAPVWNRDEDLLVIPDERDAIWLELDGREALSPLARTSSIQFTFSVSPESAVVNLNKLGMEIDWFLKDYPQEKIWRKYIEQSRAGYRQDRYGGPLVFESLEDYCSQLSRQEVVVGPKLVGFDKVNDLNIPLFLRSVWWYFRLRRYGDSLCIEIRPMPRRSDDTFEKYLTKVLEVLR